MVVPLQSALRLTISLAMAYVTLRMRQMYRSAWHPDSGLHFLRGGLTGAVHMLTLHQRLRALAAVVPVATDSGNPSEP